MTTSNDAPIKPNLLPQRQLQQVADARRDVETRLAGLRNQLESDLPFVSKTLTKNGAWAVVALGVAAGLAFAYRSRQRRR